MNGRVVGCVKVNVPLPTVPMGAAPPNAARLWVSILRVPNAGNTLPENEINTP